MHGETVKCRVLFQK